jgi:excisionase family DNA binding protein
MKGDDLMYSIREAAEIIGVQVRTIREWLKLGKIHGEKNPISQRWFFTEEEVKRVAEVYRK